MKRRFFVALPSPRLVRRHDLRSGRLRRGRLRPLFVLTCLRLPLKLFLLLKRFHLPDHLVFGR